MNSGHCPSETGFCLSVSVFLCQVHSEATIKSRTREQALGIFKEDSVPLNIEYWAAWGRKVLSHFILHWVICIY